MSSSSISLCPGTWLRGVLVVGHRRRVGHSTRDFLHQRRGRSREVTREVLLPLILDGIQYIMRGGTAWWRLPVEFWSTGTVSAVFARKKSVHETRPETHRKGLRIWISTNPSALDGTPESARSGAACGTRSALSTVREAHAPVLLCLAEASDGANPPRSRSAWGVTGRWGDPSTPHRCTHCPTNR